MPSIELARDQLLSDIERWIRELSPWEGERGTLWYGIFDRACKQFEDVLVPAVSVYVEESRAEANQIVAAVGQGKSFDRFTLGQCLNVLRGLDKQHLLLPEGRRLPRGEWKALERVVATRNEFAHSRLRYDDEAIRTTLKFLGDVRVVCDSTLVMSAVEMAT